MKKLISISFIFAALMAFSFSASAQIIIIEPGGCNDCQEAPPAQPPVVYRQPVRRTPIYNRRPAVSPITSMVPIAPFQIINSASHRPLRRWGMGLVWISGGDGYGAQEGGGVTFQYMFSRQWGVEVGFEGLISYNDYDYNSHDIVRSSLSALWFLSGVKNEGIAWYMKAGVVSQSITTYDGDYYDGNTHTGSSLQAGGGVQWRMLDGFISFSIEAMIIGSPGNDEEDYSDDDLTSFNIRFISSVHF
jgi:hypothetical protein